MKNNRFVAIVLIPAMALLALFIIYPILSGFVIAMFDYNPLRAENPFVGFSNYQRLFTDNIFKKATFNTLFFVIVTVAINLATSLIVAHLLTHVRRRWMRNALLVMIFLPCVAPLANSSVVWSRSILPTKDGVLNMALGMLGVPPINWIGNPNVLLWTLIIFTLWADVGYNTVLFGAGMDGISNDFYEAAEIDGAGAVSKFFLITLPLLGRTISFVTAMTLISHFQMFPQFQIIARDGGAANAGQVLSTYIYYVGFKTKDMGYASAISVALFLIILVVTIFQQRLNRVDWGY